MTIRQPAVAGMFYPAQQDVLRKKLSEKFRAAQIVLPADLVGRTISVTPKILIVPHAGVGYSGRVAAAGFNLLRVKDIKKVILLGASHRRWFDHVAVYTLGRWQTPLGKIEADEMLASKIVNGDNIISDLNTHQDEHSLEVELIFLQAILKKFMIVPILISEISDKLADTLAERIAENFDERTILVISSDLSHYPPYEVANESDKKTINGILTGDADKFEQTIQQVEDFGYAGLETAACGHKAIKIGLKVGEILGIKNYQLIKYENSGDVGADKSGVVGYAAIIGVES